MIKYDTELETKMCAYYHQLGERARRHYASLEALKLGHGGKKYIGNLLHISQKTLRKGIAELENLSAFQGTGQRKAGGGRKSFFLSK